VHPSAREHRNHHATMARRMRLRTWVAVATIATAGCGGGAHGGGRPAGPTRAAPNPGPTLPSRPVTLTLRPAGPVRVLPPGFMGFNAEALTAPSSLWSDPGFLAAVARLHPGALRIFGGTTANYWDWRAGTFVTGPAVPPELAAARSRIHLPITVWARLIARTGARPLFDLNLVTSTLTDQLAMLRAARRTGLPIQRIELGNELYLPRYAERFPTGTAYGRVATRWIRAIKGRYPGVQVAVSAYLPGGPGGPASTAREQTWNADVRSTVDLADAMAFHPYFRSGLGEPVPPVPGRAAAAVLGAPWERFAALRASALDQLGSGMQAWMTEWNLFDRQAPVHGTWSQGLAVAAFGLDLLSDPRITQADNHALVASAPFASIFGDANGLSFGPLPGSPRGESAQASRDAGPQSVHPAVVSVAGFTVPDHRPPTTARFGLSAGGAAMSELLNAVRGTDRAQPLTLVPPAGDRSAGGPLPSGGPAQQAELVRGPRRWTLVVVNLDRRAVAVRGAGLASRRGSYEQLAAAPQTLVAGPWSLERRHGRVPRSGTLVLAPYSLTRVWSG